MKDFSDINIKSEQIITEEEIKRFWAELPWTPRVIKPKKLFTLNTLLYACDKIRPVGYASSVEKHDFWEFIMVSQGHAKGVSNGNEFNLSDGMMFAHKPMSYHGVRETGGEPIRIMIASFEILGDAARFFENKLFRLNAFQCSLFKAACISLDSYYKGIGTDVQLQNGIALFEALLTDIITASLESNDEKDPRYHEILEVMNYNLHKKLTFDELCAKCNMSKSLMKKIFKKHSDCGVMTYFLRLKIRHAAELLCEGISAEEIAKKLSFSSTEYFLYCFKRETGLTPRQYVKKHG